MNVSVQRAAKLPEAVPASEFHKRLDELLPMIEAQANEAETLGYPDRRRGRRHAQGRHLHHAVSAGGGRSGAVAVRRDDRNPNACPTPMRRSAGASSAATWKAPPWPSTSRTKASRKSSPLVRTSASPATACRAAIAQGRRRLPPFRGNWAYGSGIHHAEWIHSGCFLTDAAGKAVSNQLTMIKLSLRHIHDAISDTATFAHRAAPRRIAAQHADAAFLSRYSLRHPAHPDGGPDRRGVRPRAARPAGTGRAHWTVFGVTG